MTPSHEPARLDELPAALALEADALCDDFERHWRRARRLALPLPATETFLARASAESRPALAHYLHELERELRTGVVLPAFPGLAVEEEIGRGGMGVVYRARRIESGALVALKLIPGAEHARWSRWLAELADLRHPNLVPFEAFGTHEQLHFVIMPFVPGGDLRERFAEFAVANGGRAASRRVAALIAKVAEAVAFLHGRGILHRDLKPSNILLTSGHDPEPLVCDFGLAGRLDGASPEAGHVVGTPRYMAPEQTAGQPLTAAADVWGLGAILHELLTGQPFRLDGSHTLSGHEPLERICLRCLDHDINARYGTAAELARDLRQYLEQP